MTLNAYVLGLPIRSAVRPVAVSIAPSCAPTSGMALFLLLPAMKTGSSLVVINRISWKERYIHAMASFLKSKLKENAFTMALTAGSGLKSANYYSVKPHSYSSSSWHWGDINCAFRIPISFNSFTISGRPRTSTFAPRSSSNSFAKYFAVRNAVLYIISFVTRWAISPNFSPSSADSQSKTFFHVDSREQYPPFV